MNRVILASASIGRKKLFQETFKDFTTSVSNIDESRIKMDSPHELTRRLALLKSRTIAKFYPDDFVIGFDTVVVCEGQVVGKPKDLEEARAILKFLSGKQQTVITGYCILNQARKMEINECTETLLHFRELTDAFIAEYVKKNPVTKFAGAYGAQDRDDFIEIVDGDMDNVIGAPMKDIVTHLKKAGFTGIKPRPRGSAKLSSKTAARKAGSGTKRRAVAAR